MTLDCIYSRLCILFLSTLCAASSLAQDKNRTAPGPDPAQSLATANTATSSDDAYIKVYQEALSRIKSAEDELIIRPDNWMHAARDCQKAIAYLPTLEVSAQKVDATTRSRMNIHRALKVFCAPIMRHALSKINRQCKAYWMLRDAFDYFVKRDTAYWKPKLKKLRKCK